MAAIVFDLDGTLIDSAPDLHAAANRLLAREGCSPLSLEQVTSFIGNGVPTLVARVIQVAGLDTSPASLAAFTERFLADYNERASELTQLYPAVYDTLEQLRANGHPLGICTNKPEKPTRKILTAFGIDHMFEVVVGGDSLPVHKPDPRPLLEAFSRLKQDHRFYIGDSEVDAQTAEAANVPFLLFARGYRKSPIDALTHMFSFDDFVTVPDFIQNHQHD